MQNFGTEMVSQQENFFYRKKALPQIQRIVMAEPLSLGLRDTGYMIWSSCYWNDKMSPSI
jgi:hypothetical protein